MEDFQGFVLINVAPSETPRGLQLSGLEPQQRLNEFMTMTTSGRGSRVVKISDRGWPYQEFEPSTTKDPPFTGAMNVKSVESSNVFPLVHCGS
ncbi:hypothetical protein TNCV_1171581 [Trichonephila clavipes]|nr:hypothetical protein TNCV_1171581 [Trichonephila clavipes]